jgi:hypothetical protein
MIEAAKAIRPASSGTSNFRLREGERWTSWLRSLDHILTKQYGSYFRELLHIFAECYRQHAFVGDQAHMRRNLHWSSKRAHRDLDVCEWPACPWRSHDCEMDEDSGRGHCAFLPEHAAEEGQAISSPDAQQSSTSKPAQPSSRLVAACRRTSAALIKLRRGASEARPHDEEQGPASEDSHRDAAEPKLGATSQDPGTQAAGTPLAVNVDSSAEQVDREAVVSRIYRAVDGPGSTEDEELHNMQRHGSSMPSRPPRVSNQDDETGDQSSPGFAQYIHANSSSRPSEVGSQALSASVRSMDDSGNPVERLHKDRTFADRALGALCPGDAEEVLPFTDSVYGAQQSGSCGSTD